MTEDKHILVESELYEKVRKQAEKNDRTIKGELAHILKKEFKSND